MKKRKFLAADFYSTAHKLPDSSGYPGEAPEVKLLCRSNSGWQGLLLIKEQNDESHKEL